MCEICGSSFRRYLSHRQVEAGLRGRFCSRKCQSTWRRMNIDPMKFTFPRVLKQTVTPPTDPSVLGYIAAFLDGEGSVVSAYASGRFRRIRHPHVVFTNTHLPTLNWIRRQLGGGGNLTANVGRKGRKPHWKVCYSLQYQSLLDNKAILSALLPYLHIKKAKAEDVLRYISSRESVVGAPLYKGVPVASSAWAPGV